MTRSWGRSGGRKGSGERGCTSGGGGRRGSRTGWRGAPENRPGCAHVRLQAKTRAVERGALVGDRWGWWRQLEGFGCGGGHTVDEPGIGSSFSE